MESLLQLLQNRMAEGGSRSLRRILRALVSIFWRAIRRELKVPRISPDRDCAVDVERTGSGSNFRKASDVRFELPRPKIHAAPVRSRFSL